MTTRRMAQAAGALALTFTVAACGQGSSSSSPTSAPASSSTSALPTPSTSPTGQARDVAFRTTLTSAEKSLAKVGPDQEVTYGWNDLRGQTTFEGAPAVVRLQGSVWYLKGTGPFTGFLTLTFADSSTLAMEMLGTATATGDSTSFTANLTVMGGTGKYAQASGTGSWTGSRSGTVGNAVDFSGTVNLRT